MDRLPTRRRFLQATGGALLAGALIGDRGRTASNGAWRQFAHDPTTATGRLLTAVLVAVDDGGDPVGNVTLRASWDGGESTVETAANGHAFVDVPADTEITVEVPDPDYERTGPAGEYVHTVTTDGEEIAVPVTERSSPSTTSSTRTTTAPPTTTRVDRATYREWMDGVEGYDGEIVDGRGESEVAVAVGAGAGFAFDPPALRVDPGTTITWEWTGEGGPHNVVGENRGFTSGEPVERTTYERTFEEPGVVLYFCHPHQATGMRGAVVVGDRPLPTSTADPGTTGAGSTPAADQEGGDGGVGPLETALGLGLLGIGGGAVWWRRRQSDADGGDGDPEAPPSGPRPDAPGESTGGDGNPEARGTDPSADRSPRSAPGARPPTDTPPGDASTGNPATDRQTGPAPAGRTGAGDPRSPPSSGRERPTGSADRHVPETIPRAPDLSIEYGALTEREPIGSGGEADVVRATARTPDGPVTVAVKTPRMAETMGKRAVERLLEEAETWSKIDDHDHVVGVVDYGSDPVPWIAMEYMDGGHLGERTGRMDLLQALWTAIAVTKGVRHAHRRGVAHLDLKPQNVLFRTVEGAWDVPKVGDWGLSKLLIDHSKSVEGLSPGYAAPEHFTDEYGPADDLTDVYQLGVLFYDLFTGRPPFEGDPAAVMRQVLDERPPPPSEVADVPRALDDVLLPALAKSKADRYDDVIYLRDALQELYREW